MASTEPVRNPPAPITLTVQGTALHVDGKPLTGKVVRAVDKGLRTEKPLGEARTDDSGHYRITYRAEQLRHPGENRAVLVVRVFDPDQAQPLAVSDPLCNAPADATIDVVVRPEGYQPPSEYESLLSGLSADLDGVAIANLTDADVAFLACETGYDRRQIIDARFSAVAGRAADLQPAVFYGMAREGLPTDLLAILGRGPDVWRQALTAAIDGNIIPAALRGSLDAVVARLKGLAVRESAKPPADPRQANAASLAGRVLKQAGSLETFLGLYLDHRGPVEDFWRRVGQVSQFAAPGTVEKLQLTFQLGALTGNHQPLIDQLLQLHDQGKVKSLRDLAGDQVEDWKRRLETTVNGQQVGAPADTPGANDAEKITNYARSLVRLMEDAFPTARVAALLQKDVPPGTEDLRRFLANNPDLELGGIPVDAYAARRGDAAWAGIQDRPTATAQLQQLQRVFKVTPRYSEIQMLRGAGFGSALHIARQPRATFADRFGGAVGVERALALHDAASDQAALAQIFLTSLSVQVNPPVTQVLQQLPTDLAQVANYATLFGSADSCECEECLSVLSPAAYLVDLLALLKDQPADGGGDVLSVLLSRRGDLQRIPLSCANTNTVLPYIDLVNEVLEDAVAQAAVQPKPAPFIPDTTGTSDELSVTPQNLNEAAYEVLKQAVYPWSLPFDLGAETARVYFTHLGISRYRLMELFRPLHAASGGTEDDALAREYLRLPAAEWDVLSGTTGPGTTPHSLNDVWGVPASPPLPGPLNQVPVFLEHTGLTLPELYELLASAFVGGLGGVSLDPVDSCDTTKMTLKGLSAATLGPLAWFLRLRRRLGWSVSDLDRTLAAMKPPQRDATVLRRLWQIGRLRDDLGVPLAEILTWWYPLDGPGQPGRPTFYDGLFLNSAVLNPPDAAFTLTGTDFLEDFSSGVTPRHRRGILAGLRITEAELDSLLNGDSAGHLAPEPLTDKVPPPAGSPPGDVPRLTLENLSRLYRVASMARALQLTVRELLVAKALVGVTFPLTVEATGPFVERVQDLRASDFGVAELDYLLRGVDVPSAPVVPPEQAVAAALNGLRAGLYRLLSQTTPPLSSSDADARTRDLVIQNLSLALRLDPKSVLPLIGLRPGFGDPTQPLLEDIRKLGTKDPSNEVNSADPQDQFAFSAYVLLDKIARLVQRFRLGSDELADVAAPRPGMGWVDATAFRGPVGAAAPGAFEGWRTLARYVRLRDQLGPPASPLVGLLEEATQPGTLKTVVDKFAGLLGARAADAEGVATQLGLTESDLASGAGLVRLKAGLDALTRLGASAATVASWTAAEMLLAAAREVKKLAKSKYDNATWLSVGKPLQDVLRGQQRDALVAYLVNSLAAQGVTGPDDLLAYYLLDVEMSPCQATSRLEAAIGSVQTFIQDCLLQQEKGLSLSPDVARWWRWMQNYRVWQANREVFLWPENWTEYELLDLKSPIFQDFERRLGQRDITNDAAEDAFRVYLDELHTIGRLQVRGVYHDVDDPAGNGWGVLHVFGRTWVQPYVFYYRTRVGKTTWTAWERVDVDIEGDYLTPVVVNRRPHVFWPQMKQVADPGNNPVPPSDGGTTPKLRWEIRFAWSERKNGKWSAKKIADPDNPLVTSNIDPSELWVLRPVFTDTVPAPGRPPRQQLNIRVYHWYTIGGTGGVYETADFPFSSCQEDVGPLSPFTFTGVNTQAGFFVAPAATDPVPGEYRGTATQSDVPVSFPTGEAGENDNYDTASKKISSVPVFTTPLPSWNLVPPWQYPQFGSQDAFFFEDLTRTFFVEPARVLVSWRVPTLVDPGLVHRVQPPYTAVVVNPAVDPIGPVLSHLRPPLSYSPAARAVRHEAPAPTGGSPSPGAPAVERVSVATSIKPVVGLVQEFVFQVSVFYHPAVCEFLAALNDGGVDGLLTLDEQTFLPGQQTTADGFFDTYKPDYTLIDSPRPHEDVDFDRSGPYAQYNWELFFYAPMLIATRLATNLKFDDAFRWFHRVFDPTSGGLPDSGVERCWKVLPFYNEAKSPSQLALPIQKLLALLDETDPKNLTTRLALAQEIAAWRDNPFNPHLLARLRPIAYQKNVFMRYIDALLAAGDMALGANTRESIRLATLYYVLASRILGPLPPQVPRQQGGAALTFRDLLARLDDFSAAVENLLPPSVGGTAPAPGAAPLPFFTCKYFCVPPNAKLLAYWDTVGDRLFKVRHCMNIEGQVEQLPLFAPRIEPGLLVQAVARGIDLKTALSDLEDVPLPYYRFGVLQQKAVELCNDVKALGAAVLAAYERSDAEQLALLRSSQEVALLNAVRDLRRRQLDEANATLQGLNRYQELVTARRDFYQKTLQYMNAREQQHLERMGAAQLFQTVAGALETVGSILHAIPNFDIGLSGFAASPVFTSTWGGANLGQALAATARCISLLGQQASFEGMMAQTMAGYDRRQEEWTFQGQQADKELAQVAQQIAAAQARVDIAQAELDNHDLQIENAKDVDSLLHSKFTNQELFQWMYAQAGTAYKGAYQLAYDMARRAERAFQYERADFDKTYINRLYWDNLRQGLLAGEGLLYDLRRMEADYLADNRREFEITKHISLAQLDPVAFLMLRETGQAFVNVPESIFDRDYAGHFHRRIKWLSLTLPCVTGPYTGVNCTLTLLKHSVRINPEVTTTGYARKSDPNTGEGSDDPRFADLYKDLRFHDRVAADQAIATSHGQNDTGLFELDFRDERYLPFEGAGVISQWHLELRPEANRFDLATLTDVIFHLRYTARDGGNDLKKQVLTEVLSSSPPSVTPPLWTVLGPPRAQLLIARNDFPTEWYQFLNPATDAAEQSLRLDLSPSRFPFSPPGAANKLSAVHVYVKLKDHLEPSPSDTLTFDLVFQDTPSAPAPAPSPVPTLTGDLTKANAATNLNGAAKSWYVITFSVTAFGTWLLVVKGVPASWQPDGVSHTPPRLGDSVQDIVLVCEY
jgi:hypothetical protein